MQEIRNGVRLLKKNTFDLCAFRKLFAFLKCECFRRLLAFNCGGCLELFMVHLQLLHNYKNGLPFDISNEVFKSEEEKI